MAVSKEDIEKLRAQGLTHFATLLESHASAVDEGDKGSAAIVAGSGNAPAADSIGALFEGQEEAVVKKATELFEAAVEKKVDARMALVEAQVAGQMQAYAAQQDKTVNEYLDTIVTEWLKENELKIYESSVVEQAKVMIAQVKSLFEGMGLAFDDQIMSKKLAEAEAAIAESNSIIEAQEAALIKHDIIALVTEAKVGLTVEQAAALDVIVGESEFEGIDKLKEILPTMVEAAKKDDGVPPADSKDAKGDDDKGGVIGDKDKTKDKGGDADATEAEKAAAAKVVKEAEEKAAADAAALAEAEAAAALAAKPKLDPLVEATLAQLRRGSRPAKK